MTQRIACLLTGLLLLPAAARPAQPPEILAVRVGLAGRYKVGLWTPVELSLGGGIPPGAEVSLTMPDGDGVPSRVSAAISAADGNEATDGNKALLYVRFGRIRSELTAELRVADRLVAKRAFSTADNADAEHFLPAIPSTRKLIVTVGPAPPGVRDAVRLQGRPPDQAAAVVRLDDVGQLPGRWYGYEGVDTLVLSTSRPEIYRRLAPDGERMKALDEWIGMGGKLVLCVGSRAEVVLAEDFPLRRFVPGRLEKMVSLRRTGALETYCGSSIPVSRTAAGGQPALRMPRLADCEGTILASEADLPLVIAVPRGLGRIVLLAADLDRGPLGHWPDRPVLAARLLDWPTERVEDLEETSAVMHHGYVDLAGQLRSALDRFGGVWPASFSLVAVLVAVYILLIGPADYFFLRKFTRRMQWTWLTFPAIVLAFCVGAYALAYGLKGGSIRVSQADLVDVDAATGRVRGTSWINLFSPRTQTFNLSLRPRLPGGKTPENAEVLLCWLGLSGRALGGMNARASEPGLWSQPYHFSPRLDAMRGTPIPVWSTKILTARWSAVTDVCPRAELVVESELPSGTITNTLGFPLSQSILAYDRWAYDLGTLAPGESARLGPTVKRSELQTLLTGRKLVFDEDKSNYRQESTPYDQSSAEVPYVLRAMMFFEAAGGRHYTGLSNGYQGFVDLSGLLKADRAILVARAPKGRRGAELLRDGEAVAGDEDRQVTIYRFVFPVQRTTID